MNKVKQWVLSVAGAGSPANQRRTTVNGVSFVIASTLFLTIGLYLPRLVSSHADPVQISWLRYVGGSIWLSAFHFARRRQVRPAIWNGSSKRAQAWHVARAVVGFGTLTLTVVASRLLPIGNVQAILACNGLLVLIWLLARGAEPLQWPVVAGTVLCVAGAVCSSHVELGSRSITGYATAWAASACWAAEILIFRHAVARASGKTSLLFINLVGVVLLAIPGLLRWRPVGEAECGVLLSVGIFLVVSQAFLIKALERIPLSITIPFRYLNVPVALVLGLVVLNQIPSIEAIIGTFLIMVGGTVLTRRLN
ncbi:DMT family transporter [Burkholderia perseverans]|uniref:DMT family transporter n=1 Tax=Burkholderia perseverans TaxID=2615214 RepID=UPI001FEDAB80|nr:DMT family transporter [Burkholderia perseverans]